MHDYAEVNSDAADLLSNILNFLSYMLEDHSGYSPKKFTAKWCEFTQKAMYQYGF
ncbi:hypothetical protein PEDI_40190 [Persicobacter diffluens]|uniref:Uncharacterized protein n=1 Tax=Persicobacter diffluens TaxID=981 RepID=A0AAN4W3A2_9BACT|nr:hypothetical protein PEDI_40190 [Persicobacter diffluens]